MNINYLPFLSFYAVLRFLDPSSLSVALVDGIELPAVQGWTWWYRPIRTCTLTVALLQAYIGICSSLQVTVIGAPETPISELIEICEVRACETTFLETCFGVMRKAELDIMERAKPRKL